MSEVKISSPAEEETIGVKHFVLQAVLWLPLMFFLWFVLRSAVVALPTSLAGWALETGMPTVVSMAQQDFLTNEDGVPAPMFVVTTTLPATGVAPNEFGDLPFQATTLEPLLYCYGLAMLFGLVMATPLNWRRTFAQWFFGWLLLIPIQAFGIAAAAIKQLSFESGDGLRGMVAATGLSQDMIAYCYQLGYLMLPPVMPVILWILFNRRFVERLAGISWHGVGEPVAVAHGPTLAESAHAEPSNEPDRKS